MAKRLLAALILACSLGSGAWASPSPAVVAVPPQPSWTALTAEQKGILAPLAGEWNQMENYRRKKWLGIARRYPEMKPEEQQRVQEKMRDWVRLTPEQRAAAREKFKEFNKLSPEEKQAMQKKWQEYQSLPEEEKARLKQQQSATAAPRTAIARNKAPADGVAAAALSPSVTVTPDSNR